MKNTTKARILAAGLACVFTLSWAAAVTSEATKPKTGDSFIDISEGSLSYVPRTAKFVRIDGQVKRIVKFTTTLSKGGEDCECPKCCKGSCYVIVFTNSTLLNMPIVILGIIWVSCT